MRTHNFFTSLFPFWLFVLLFKFGAGLHYSLMSALGTRILPTWMVGLLIGAGTGIALICDVPAGHILDRFGYVRLLKIATFIFLCACIALMYGLTPVTFIATLLFSTMGWVFFNPGANAYMLVSAPKDFAGRFLGFYHAIGALGIVLASASLVLLIHAHARIIGFVLSLLLFCAFFVTWFITKERGSVHDEKKIAHHEYYIRRHFFTHAVQTIRSLNPASTLLVLHNFSAGLFYGAVWFVVPLIVMQGSHHGLLGISLSVFDLAIVVLGSFLGKLADRSDKKRMVFYGLLLFAVSGSLLGFNLNLWFLVLGFLATAGDEMSGVSLWTWLQQIDIEHSEDGMVNGIIILFDDFGWMLGPVVAGFLYVLIGPRFTLALTALPIFFVWFVSILMLKKPRIHSTQMPRNEIPRRPRHRR